MPDAAFKAEQGERESDGLSTESQAYLLWSGGVLWMLQVCGKNRKYRKEY